MNRPFLPPAKAATNHLRTLTRSYVAMAEALLVGGGNPDQIAERRYSGDTATIETVKRGFVSRGAVTPLATTTSGAPVSTTLEILDSVISPMSVFRPILGGALKAEFMNSAAMSIPDITASASGVGYIQQGAPVPMRQLSISANPMVPRKLALGAVLTRELATFTNGEAFISRILSADLALGAETILFDANAASSTRPAGLKYNIAALTADSDTGSDGMIADLSNLAAAVAGTGTRIVFIASPKQYVRILLRRPADFPFSVYPSAALADRQVTALSLDALVIAGQGEPQISVSRTSAVVMADDAGAFSSVGTPNAVAAPIRSLEQTDCVGLRLIMDLDVMLRSSGGFAWTQNVAWG